MRKPSSFAFFASSPAPIITDGLEVLVHDVMAALGAAIGAVHDVMGTAAWPPPGGPVACFAGSERGRAQEGGQHEGGDGAPPPSNSITAGGLFSIQNVRDVLP